MYLAKASEIVRREMFTEHPAFSGHFNRDYIVDYVPRCLVELVSMIEHGPGIKSQIENGLTKSDFAIAQLLYFNTHKKRNKTSKENLRQVIVTHRLLYMLVFFCMQRLESDN